jgi:hypothetical protein
MLSTYYSNGRSVVLFMEVHRKGKPKSVEISLEIGDARLTIS